MTKAPSYPLLDLLAPLHFADRRYISWEMKLDERMAWFHDLYDYRVNLTLDSGGSSEEQMLVTHLPRRIKLVDCLPVTR